MEQTVHVVNEYFNIRRYPKVVTLVMREHSVGLFLHSLVYLAKSKPSQLHLSQHLVLFLFKREAGWRHRKKEGGGGIQWIQVSMADV